VCACVIFPLATLKCTPLYHTQNKLLIAFSFFVALFFSFVRHTCTHAFLHFFRIFCSLTKNREAFRNILTEKSQFTEEGAIIFTRLFRRFSFSTTEIFRWWRVFSVLAALYIYGVKPYRCRTVELNFYNLPLFFVFFGQSKNERECARKGSAYVY